MDNNDLLPFVSAIENMGWRLADMGMRSYEIEDFITRIGVRIADTIYAARERQVEVTLGSAQQAGPPVGAGLPAIDPATAPANPTTLEAL